jgi:secondary thiamine-phosphate synthase enzyme
MSTLKTVNKRIHFNTQSAISFTDLTLQVNEAVAEFDVQEGLVHVFAPHATGILLLTENDPALLEDIKYFLEKIAPSRQAYRHPSNAHAHLRSIMFPPEKTLPITDGQVEFGTWQSLLFVETDVYPRKRTVIIQIIGQ